MITGQSDQIDVACELRHESDQAWLIFDGTRQVWLPKRLVELEYREATMPEWFARD